MGKAKIRLGWKDPRCRPRPHVALRLNGTRLKADGLLPFDCWTPMEGFAAIILTVASRGRPLRAQRRNQILQQGKFGSVDRLQHRR